MSKKWNLMKNLVSFYLNEKAFKREFNCSYQTHYNGSKTENTHELFEEKNCFNADSKTKRTNHQFSFVLCDAHTSLNQQGRQFYICRRKIKHKTSQTETKIAGRKFWNEKKK